MKLAVVGLASMFVAGISAVSHAAAPFAKDGDHFHLEAWIDGPCKVGGNCTIKFKVVAKNGFHVNTEFPTGFKAKPEKGTEKAGDHTAKVTEALGEVSAPVKWTKGDALEGIAKFAVCSEDKRQCEPNSVDLVLKP